MKPAAALLLAFALLPAEAVAQDGRPTIIAQENASPGAGSGAQSFDERADREPAAQTGSQADPQPALRGLANSSVTSKTETQSEAATVGPLAVGLLSATLLLLLALLVAIGVLIRKMNTLPQRLAHELKGYSPERIRELVGILERIASEQELRLREEAGQASGSETKRPMNQSGLEPLPPSWGAPPPAAQKPARESFRNNPPAALTPNVSPRDEWPSDRRPPEAARPASSISGLQSSAESAVILRQFNQLAANFTPRDSEAFEEAFIEGIVSEFAPGELAADPDGNLWLAPLATSDALAVVLPGREMIKNWEKFFRTSARNAERRLGSYYDLERGMMLSVKVPALVRREGATWRLANRGSLTGV